MNLIGFFKIIRIHFFTASFTPFFIGMCMAYQLTDINIFYMLLTFLGIFFIHAAINVIDDYGDFISGNDISNENKSRYSGGSKTLEDKILTPNQLLALAIVCFIIGGLIGLYLNFKVSGNLILFIGIFGLFISIFYSIKPFKFSYRGLSEILCGIGFGPLILLGTFYVQVENITTSSALASIIPGVSLVILLYINEYPDYEADKYSDKKTLVVRLGKERGIVIFYILFILIYGTIIFGTLFDYFPIYSLLSLITLILVVRATQIIHNYINIDEFLEANKLLYITHFLVGILFGIGWLI